MPSEKLTVPSLGVEEIKPPIRIASASLEVSGKEGPASRRGYAQDSPPLGVDVVYLDCRGDERFRREWQTANCKPRGAELEKSAHYQKCQSH